QQEIYQRTFINVPIEEPSGFGNFVAGVDLDGDGKLEVYAVNNDWNDVGRELIPTLYKFEQNAQGGWDSVWAWVSPIPLQNTWPSLCVGDLDGDGRKEIIWGPVNYTDATSNPNPPRILVFESVPGQDSLGVNNGPNTIFRMTNDNMKNIRPFKFQAHDFNNDGKDELVFSDRANSVYRFGVVGVNKVPNDGDTTGVVWSYKYEGFANNAAINAGTYYDFAIVDSTIFFINTNGNVQPLLYANGTYSLRAAQVGLVPGGSWKSSAVVNLDGGSKKIMVAGWTSTAANRKVRVLKKMTDSTLVEAAAIDMNPYLIAGGQLYSGAAGDIDGDGKPDYVVGTRDNGAKVFRIEFQGGDVDLNTNYTVTEIDRGVVSTETRMDVAVANVDGKAGDEVFYTSSVGGRVPITVLSNGKKGVNVTFRANTSMVPDTLNKNSFVQVRGGGAQITWGNDSPAKMKNAGGDYWTYTALVPAGDTIPYKFFTNANKTITGDSPGWEGDTRDWGNGNRRLVVPDNDVVLPVEYVNGFNGDTYKQADATFNNNQNDDTVWAHVRVNMQSYPDFNPAIHVLGVRGSFASSGWGTTIPMHQEQPHANGGSRQYNAANFYYLDIPWKKSFLDTATDAESRIMRYKFVIHLKDAPLDEDWGKMVDNPNFQLEWNMPNKDTTQAWVWYRGVPYVAPKGTDSVTVKFSADFTTALTQKGFTPGDTIVVKYGWGSTAAEVYSDTLKKVGVLGQKYETVARKIGGVGASPATPVWYQYYLEKPGNEIREIFYDFGYTGADPAGAERRKFEVPSNNATITVYDTSKSIVSLHRQPIFQNTGKLSKNVQVTFTCDLRPAYYHLKGGDSLFDAQGSFRTIVPADADSVYSWGVWMNGPAVGGWSNPGGSDWGVGLRTNNDKKMYDDGTHGDAVAGDHIYTLQVNFYKDSLNNTVGQIFKFGLYGGDNEGGKGGFGNNHAANIDDATGTATIADQFGSINPTYYSAWDYDKHETTLGVQKKDDVIPTVFSLDQNFPNPFNPTTTIQYAIPTESFVTLKVYNMLGQEVATVVNENLKAGKYSATFNASRLASGVYVYRIEAGSFVSVKKMMLLK
ncbi:MAG: VCBS repeat-containing protein, partial [Bacteroidetes bacterium]|nr:VCBS repeat-containing protein [Bacteroidota bacterium]